jgi:glycosyltransferase involved in cell wall biosynthesis
MKIIVVTKTLNEEKNIAHFCNGFDWADKILIADGGSIDRTTEIASHFPNAYARDFDHRINMPDAPEGFMNPEPEHLNFIIDWAVDEGADWIVLDGADCWPNPALRRDARELLEETDKAAVHLHRLYLWGQGEYFPKYNVSTALWAWRPDLMDIRCEERGRTSFEARMLGIDPDRALHLEAPPYCALHYFAPDEETIQRKLKRYAAWGFPQKHPLKSMYAPPEPLPGWVFE